MRLFFLGCLTFFLISNLPAQIDSLVYFRYPNGTISGEGYLKDGKPEGYWKNYFQNAKIKSEGLLVNGNTNGIWKFYFESGFLNVESEYEDGKKQGFRKLYADSGIIQIWDYYVNDIRNGWASYYDEKGIIKRKVYFEKGLETGLSAEYANDGRIISLDEYRNGSLIRTTKVNRYDQLKMRTGVWVETDSLFHISTSTQYQNNLKNGLKKYYDTSGNLIKIEKYFNDVLIKDEARENSPFVKNSYSAEGKIKSRGAYVDGRRVGTHTFYNNSGQADSLVVYYGDGAVLESGSLDSTGKKQGEWISYYPDGKEKSKGFYIDDKKSGTWTYFFNNGMTEQTGKYSNGLPDGQWRWYYETGQILRDEFYRKGREDGFAYELFPSGDTLSSGEFYNGQREGIWTFQDGDQKLRGSFVAGEMNGTWTHFYLDGVKSFEGNFRDGQAEGLIRSWYPDGSLKWKGNCEAGKRTGVWNRYDQQGNLIFSITYEDGVEKKYNGVGIYPEFFPTDYESLIQRNPYIF
jgi:antitoxin component YwqK of YwqJK toxin-antitoxin module